MIKYFQNNGYISINDFCYFIYVWFLAILILLTSCRDNNCNDPVIQEKRYFGLCYGPFRDNEDPDFGINPTHEALREDIAFIQGLTKSIRTYGVYDGLEHIPYLCEEFRIDCYPGAWITNLECVNEWQINSLISIANQNLSHVKGLIVGNEVLLRGDVSEEQLINYINRVKAETNLPVGTAETYSDWIYHPDLADAVDIMFVHIYPYWVGRSIDESMPYVISAWNSVKNHFPEKRMVIGETGWPSEGRTIHHAVPGKENQKRYFTEFVKFADENEIEYFYFAIFDEKWKRKFEGETGAHWGLYYSDGSVKEHLIDILPENVRGGISRPPRIVHPTVASLPITIYKNGCDLDNKFYASGWLGELADLKHNDSIGFNPKEYIDESFPENTFSGETCIRITYTPSPSGKGWGGIYWQFPINNWGDYPGFDFSSTINPKDSILLSFWARGESGNEIIEFSSGGINNITKPYRDSHGPVSTGDIQLTKGWVMYTIDLTGKNMTTVIGGFSWVATLSNNPSGVVFYLDDIKIEKKFPDK
jgi:exo-beta-1,3-glucanase (GH17 family)